MSDSAIRLPHPFGDEVQQGEWQRVFNKMLLYNPELNFYNGFTDLRSKLLAADFSDRNTPRITVDDFPPSAPPAFRARGRLLLIRGHYFESGLHHRLSFHGLLERFTRYDGNTAIDIRLQHPLRRVTTLIISYPGDNHPLYVEVSLRGAPPEVRILDTSSPRLQTYAPSSQNLFPISRVVVNERIQIFDVGPVLARDIQSRAAELLDETQAETESPDTVPADKSSKITDPFHPLTDEFPDAMTFRFPDVPLRKRDDTEPAILAGTPVPQSMTAMPTAQAADGLPGIAKQIAEEDVSSNFSDRALVVVAKDDLREKFGQLLAAMGWTVQVFKRYNDPGPDNYKGIKLLVLDSHQGNVSGEAIYRRRLREGQLRPGRFLVVVDPEENLDPRQWAGLGVGLTIRSSSQPAWIKRQLESWLATPYDSSATDKLITYPTALLISNDHILLDTIDHSTLQRQYQMIHVEDGRDAVRIALALRPGIVLLDLDIVQPSGSSILQKIRTFHATRDIPVFVFTHPETPDWDEARKHDDTYLFTKPLDPILFTSVLHTLQK